MSKHTPGPWFHHGPSGYQHTMGGYINSTHDRNGSTLICSIYGTDGQPHLENASLIAAAPDMFDALIDCRRALELANLTGELAVVDAAIAKAKGLNPDQV